MNSNIIIHYVLFTGLLYLLYKAAFKQMKFFQWNRVLLLSMPLVAFLIAIIAPQFQSPAALQGITLPEISLSERIVTNNKTSESYPWIQILYLSGALFMGISAILGFIKILIILKSSKPAVLEDIPYRKSEKVQNPFTFISSIVMPSTLPPTENTRVLLIHEQEHRKQRHTLDNIYYSLINVIGWFNPFTHLLAKELRMVHEAQADAHSLTQASQEEYARMLLSSTFGSPGLINRTVSPFFNSSFIKNRITMLYKKDNPKWMRIYYALVLPIITGMILFACNKVEEQTSPPPPPVPKEALAFNKVDQPPLFKNCDVNASKEEQLGCFKEGLANHIIQNFKYPEKALEKELTGTIYVNFIIDENGNVKNTEVRNWRLNSESGITFNPQTVDGKTLLEPEPAMQESFNHAKAIVKSLPQLKPAMVNGNAVSVEFILPISLKL